MATYTDELTEKNYVPNLVVRIMGNYYCIRQPDSGLVIPSAQQGVVRSLNLNPTQIDPFNATTTVNTNSFSLLDRGNVITALFASNPQIFQGELCEIWLGRSFTDMAFADYLKLTDTYISKVTKNDSSYNFSTKEAQDRLATGAFSTQAKLAVDILVGTTIITVQDVTNLPASGLIKIDDEFISYTGIIGNNLQNCVRGEQSSVPSAHDGGSDIYLCELLQGNPITLLLQLLISDGGGGVYDVLNDGADINQNLIDVAEFENIRDEYFSGYTFKFILFNLDSLRKFLETEILFPLGVRLRSNNNSKIGLAVLDRPTLNVDAPDLDHSLITKIPTYDVDDTKIFNKLRIEWNYNDATGKYLNLSEYTDATSEAQFGHRKPFAMKFKGLRSTLAGQTAVDKIAEIFFLRFAFPKPNVSLNAQMKSSLWLLGEKAFVESSLIPTSAGDLNFGDSLEIMQRAINYQTGDVNFRLSFNAMTGLRACFIAPSDTIATVTTQKVLSVGAGRGDNYRAEWKMRLYSNVTRNYVDAQVNEIASVVGDVVTFVDAWTTTLVASDHRIMFADYDQVSEQQKKFCFISDDGNTFTDGKPSYIISF